MNPDVKISLQQIVDVHKEAGEVMPRLPPNEQGKLTELLEVIGLKEEMEKRQNRG
jgi:hypothetical protein